MLPAPAIIGARGRRCSHHHHHHHDVFISFRGTDVRNTFVAHLRAALRRKGITTFADDTDDSLPRGENLKEAIPWAIERSMFYVVVLSPNYASSEWCLDELVTIMRCCDVDERGRRCHKAVPIFYHLSPEEVASGGGCFRDVLEGHKSRYTYERVDGWLQALAWIAGISGWVVHHSRSEARLVDRISRTMRRKLRELPRIKMKRKSKTHDEDACEFK